MINKRGLIIGIFLVITIFFLTLSVPNISAAEPEVSVCCEKTLSGAWCQDANQSSCDVSNGLRTSPSSCQATSYCKLGTCINSKAGGCQPNVPARTCSDNGGTWSEKKASEIPQCQLGCCIIGDNAQLATQVQCKTTSSLFGLSTSFKADIKDAVQCFSLANSDVKGACVFDEDFERTCKLTSKKDCAQKNIDLPDSNVSFHEGFLCTAEELLTNCAPDLKQTTCVTGKDQVYFKDTCNNLANVYDSSKANDVNYWKYIQEPSESCSPSSSNAGSTTCGNCDYYLGSTCRDFSKAGTSSPSIGTNICAPLSCKYNGVTYKHGESWCSTGLGTGTTAINADDKRANILTPGIGVSEEGVGVSEDSTGRNLKIESTASTNVPGAEYYKLTCYDGEVTQELCGDGFRNEVCIQSGVQTNNSGVFKSAVCSTNKWQDCTAQPTKAICEDIEQRDCKWIDIGVWQPNQEGDKAPLIKKDSDTGRTGACVPLYSPGFDTTGILNTTNSQNESSILCSQGNVVCVIKYETKFLGSAKVVRNFECVKNYEEGGYSNTQWRNALTNMCVSLGDCGATLNYIGEKGSSSIDLTYSGRK